MSYAPIPVSAITGDDNWHLSFKIPSLSAFSERTIDAIRTGAITKAVRTEIVQTITTLISVHTKRPTSKQYTHICKELVKAYPKLEDDASIEYVSFISIVCRYTFKGASRAGFRAFREMSLCELDHLCP